MCVQDNVLICLTAMECTGSTLPTSTREEDDLDGGDEDEDETRH